MRTHNFLFTLSTAIVMAAGCVTQEKYDKLSQERDSIAHELYIFKFSAPAMLSDAKRLYAANDLNNAKVKLRELIHDFSGTAEKAEGENLLKLVEEQEHWNLAISTVDTGNTISYLQKHPNGKYVSQARSRLIELRIKTEQLAYENAVNANNSSTWKEFLSGYPNHPEAESIKEKIIRLEVDEILAGDHGNLPAPQQTSYNYSSTSRITIENTTSYLLTIRYSGPEAKLITIDPDRSQVVYLQSGSYRVAATANGLHYGGEEDLHGNYSSRYYITTTTSYRSSAY